MNPIKIFVSYSHQNSDWVDENGKYGLIAKSLFKSLTFFPGKSTACRLNLNGNFLGLFEILT